MIDKLIEEIQKKKNPSVVGLDPTLEMMPDYLLEEYTEKYGKTENKVFFSSDDFLKRT